MEEASWSGTAHGTPFLRIKAHEILPRLNLNTAEFNKNLTDSILSLYGTFVRQFGPKLYEMAGDKMGLGLDMAGDINAAFFKFQSQGGWDKYLRNKPHVKLFSNLASQLYGLFSKKCGVPGLRETIEEEVRESDGELSMAEEMAAGRLQPWATVHCDGNSHPLHDHTGSAYSAVYYVKVPKDAGMITFQDPRGVRDADLVLKPEEGDFIMFPSWLKHQVGSTPGGENRISIAWNTYGKWDKLDATPLLEMPKLQGDDALMSHVYGEDEELLQLERTFHSLPSCCTCAALHCCIAIPTLSYPPVSCTCAALHCCIAIPTLSYPPVSTNQLIDNSILLCLVQWQEPRLKRRRERGSGS